MIEADTAESVEEVDTALRRLQGMLADESGDLAVAVEQITDALQKEDDLDDPEEAVKDITLPFYEEERETAFLIGITVGGLAELREHLKEGEEPNVDPSDLPDEGGQQVEAETTQTQSQSVTVEA